MNNFCRLKLEREKREKKIDKALDEILEGKGYTTAAREYYLNETTLRKRTKQARKGKRGREAGCHYKFKKIPFAQLSTCK